MVDTRTTRNSESYFSTGNGINKTAIQNYLQVASELGSHWIIKSSAIVSFIYSPPLSGIYQFYSNTYSEITLSVSEQAFKYNIKTMYIAFLLMT